MAKKRERPVRLDIKAITLLALILGITSVGQFALKGWEFFGESMLIPPFVARIIVFVLFWTSLILVFVALNLYRKL